MCFSLLLVSVALMASVALYLHAGIDVVVVGAALIIICESRSLSLCGLQAYIIVQ